MIKYLIAFILFASPCLAGMGIGGFPQPGPGCALSGGGSSACAGTIGRSSTSGTATQTASLYQIMLVRMPVACSTSVSSVSAYLKNIDTTSRQVIFVIYDDDGGLSEPGTLLYKSDVIHDAETLSYKHVSHTPTNIVNVDSGYIWVGVYAQSVATEWSYKASTGQVRNKQMASFSTTAVPTIWDTSGDSTSTAERVFYATLN